MVRKLTTAPAEKKTKKASSSSEASKSKSKSKNTSSSTASTSSDPKKAIVPLTWAPLSVDQVIIPSQTKEHPTHASDIAIEVKSRVVKNLETYPSDCLFRTHQYDFTLTPTRELLKWANIDYGFYSKIKLFTYQQHPQDIIGGEDLSEENESGDCWQECFSTEKRPVITDSHTEDYETGVWKIVLYWQNAKVFKFKPSARFRFEIDVYRTCADRNTMRKVATKVSSEFRLLSKPEVYLKGLTKKRKGSLTADEEEDTESITTTNNNTTNGENPRKKVKNIESSSSLLGVSNNATAVISIADDDCLESRDDEIVLDEGGAPSPILTGHKHFSDDIDINESVTVQSPILVSSHHISTVEFNCNENIQSSPPFLTPTSPEIIRPYSNMNGNLSFSSSQENGLFTLLNGPSQEDRGSPNTSDIFFTSRDKDEPPSSSLSSLFPLSQ